MKKLILLALFSLLGISAAWAQTGTLTVNVTDVDNLPIAGAMVNAIGHGHGHERPMFNGLTDEAGQIVFADIPALEYDVNAGAPGYRMNHEEINVVEGENAVLTLVLEGNGLPTPGIVVMPMAVQFGPVGIGTTFTRVVHVVNHGTGDLNVSVAVAGEAFGLASDAEFTLTPDPSGNEAEVLVTFTPTAEQPYEGTLTVTSNDPNHPEIIANLMGFGAMVVTGGLSVNVIVTDSLGESTPVDSARVRVSFIRDHGGPRPHHIGLWTDANGNVTIDALPVGIYNVNASKRGVGFASEVIEILEGQTADLTLTLVSGPGHDGPGGHGHPFEIVELAGTASVTAPDSMHPERLFYQLDVDADGVMDYRLNFGPPDYVPPSEAVRPVDGEAITLTGALMSHGEPPMVHVHTLNGLLWWDPRHGRDGEHGGDAGRRAEGFGVENYLSWIEISGTVTDVDVYGSSFYGLDTDNDGVGEYVVDLGDYFDLNNPMLPNNGDRIDVVGGFLAGTPESIDAGWIIAYEINGNFFRTPGDTDGLLPITGTAVTPTPTPIVTSHLIATNYPNPFNPTTTIQFSTPVAGLVNITVFDVLGRQVATLVNDNLSAGTYTTPFDAVSLPSGMYMYRLTLNNQSIVNRMLLLK